MSCPPIVTRDAQVKKEKQKKKARGVWATGETWGSKVSLCWFLYNTQDQNKINAALQAVGHELIGKYTSHRKQVPLDKKKEKNLPGGCQLLETLKQTYQLTGWQFSAELHNRMTVMFLSAFETARTFQVSTLLKGDTSDTGCYCSSLSYLPSNVSNVNVELGWSSPSFCFLSFFWLFFLVIQGHPGVAERAVNKAELVTWLVFRASESLSLSKATLLPFRSGSFAPALHLSLPIFLNNLAVPWLNHFCLIWAHVCVSWECYACVCVCVCAYMLRHQSILRV